MLACKLILYLGLRNSISIIVMCRTIIHNYEPGSKQGRPVLGCPELDASSKKFRKSMVSAAPFTVLA